MSWIFNALFARFLWSWGNVADKIILSNKVKNPLVYLIMSFLVNVAILPFWFIIGFRWYGWTNFTLIILGAILFFIATFFYILAVQREEISRINLLWNLMPLHGLWLSWLFLGETLEVRQLIALVILLTGSILAGLHLVGKKEKVKLSVGFWLMIVSTFLYIGCDVVTRYLTTNNIPALQLAGYQLFIFPILAIVFFFFKKFRNQYAVEKVNYNWKLLLFLLIIALFSRVGVWFNMRALSMGHISLINVLEGAQTIMVFIIAVLLTWLAPKYIKEEIDNKNLLLKLIALILMIIGLVVLNIK